VENPIFWLGVSLCLVAVSLTAVLIAALPALQELARASRSAEKLFDTLSQEFPPTLAAIRMTGQEIRELSDNLDQGVQTATGVVKQVDQSLTNVKHQVKQAQVGGKSVVAGIKAAWQVWQHPPSKSSKLLDD
jgi:uncharacterized protein YoxC